MIKTIDFNTLSTGETVTDQYLADGVTISAIANAGGVDEAMIFDSANPTPGDEDLRTADLKKLLIISQDGDETAPNDNATGGKIVFDFTAPSTVKSLTFIDLEEPARLYFYAADGTLISEQFVPANGDNGTSVVQLFVEGVDQFKVVSEGSYAVDNLIFDDNLPMGDGIVSGDDAANEIDLAYSGDPEGDRIDAGDAIIAGEAPDDDIVDALGGNDTVSALQGDDDVYAGAGDDVVSGGEGDDLIFGDRTLADGSAPAKTVRESFEWSAQGAADGDAVNSFSQDTGTTTVKFTKVAATAKTSTTFSTDKLNTDGIDGHGKTVNAKSSLESETRLDGEETCFELRFDAPVGDVDFNVNDIDGDSLVTIEAFDAAGKQVEVKLTGGSGLTLSDTDGVPGNDTADSKGGYADAANPVYNLGVDIAGPVSRITIKHLQNGADNTNINITDVFFTAGDMFGLPGGNDDLSGNAGNDTIFGEGGDDTLTGGDGDDSLDGGQGADKLNGDTGNDTLDGALGNDKLNGGSGDDSMLGGTGDDLFDGGAGKDTMTGGADRDIFFNVNAGDLVDGSEAGVDFDRLDLTGSAPEGGRLEILPDPADPTNPENGIVQYYNADGSDAGQLVFSNIEKVVPCFTPGTLIATPKGERKVEDLVVGDRVITRDNGMQVIRWIGNRDISGDELATKAHLRPVLIRQGALGNDLPERDMMVSPQHRVLVANDKTALYFEEREVLVAAKHLTDMEGIDVVEVSQTTYIHIMFDRHEVILSDGIWTESFQPGDMSLAGVGDASREEILELFPELATRDGIEAYASARKALKKHEAKLITR